MDSEHTIKVSGETDERVIVSKRHRADLSDDKQSLIRARLDGKAGRMVDLSAGSISRRPNGVDDVLSFAQQRLWFLDQLAPGNPFYTESSALRFDAQIDTGILQRTINEIVARHELLRTTIGVRDGRPVPELTASLRIPLTQIDLRQLSDKQKQIEVMKLATRDARQPFDLARGPLLRTTLLQLKETSWVFLLSLHHIVCDGWSSAVFSKELAQIYAAYAAGRPSPLPELPIQYADFAYWQRNWLRGDALAKQLNYWATQLQDLPVLELPSDRPRPAVFSYAGSRHSFTLNSDISRGLRSLGQQESATLFMTLLAGFKTVLHRITGRSDLVVGTPVANRSRAELEPLIGFFVNILVLRNELSGTLSHREVIRRIRATALGAYDHQDLPFEELVDQLQPERNLARNPLFQVVFQLHADQTGDSGSGNSSEKQALSVIEVNRATVKFDLRLEFLQTPDGLRGTLEYSTDLFDCDRIERLATYLQHTYEEMVRAPDEPIARAPLVRGQERKQIAQWNGEADKTRVHPTLGECFLAQVESSPDAVALIGNSEEFTYAQIRDKALGVAARLQECGAGLQSLVALSSERSADSVIAQLGIVLSGAAYLPLNLCDPKERLLHMIRDSGAAFAIDTCSETDWSEFDLTVVPLHVGDARADAPYTLQRYLPPVATPEALAYVMYTSGSTGLPKGVCVPHRAVLRLVTNANFCSMQPDDTYLLLAPMTFDASTLEVWAPLLNGGRLAIHPPGPLDLEQLEASVQNYRVTTMWLTAGLFHQVVDARPGALKGVRQLLAGGDVLSRQSVRNFLLHHPQARLINGYGPTENTTFSCCYNITTLPDQGSSIPIGKPVRGSKINVVDRFGHLSPIGVAGELYVSGEGLAHGYLGQPRLTAEHFVPDPFNGGGQRMYGTGDLVRFVPGGDLEFLGRIDRQVKIRGFRVEPQEIETLLVQHPGVRDAAVIARNDLGAGARLVAYITPQSNQLAQSIWSDAETTVVENWRTLYDNLYADQRTVKDEAGFDFTGWSSSFTGLDIPGVQMRQWLDNTVRRITARSATHVLEIGCGTGLLACSLLPDVKSYFGTDISTTVVEHLRAQLSATDWAAKTKLEVRHADDFQKIPNGAYDLILLNSVVQYFPSIDYFKRVLDGAVSACASGGRIFIGDLRSLVHMAQFHTGVQLSRADQTTECSEIIRRVTDAMQLEQELILDPALFYALRANNSRISRVEVQWKRGNTDNELTNFRYDVMLFIDDNREVSENTKDLDWNNDELNVEQLHDLLMRSACDIITLRNVPNTRLTPYCRAWNALRVAPALTRLGELQAELSQSQGSLVLDELWQIAEGTPFEAVVSPAADNVAHCVVTYKNKAEPSAVLTQALCAPIKWADYANSPMTAIIAESIVPELRRHLTDQLPDHLMPSVFVLLDSLPLTRNGKIDYRALPDPVRERNASSSTAYVGAQSEIQKRLALIWKSVLGLDNVGIEDNFFELGGDSILCIQVISRAKSEGIQITINQLFENQTIAQLSHVVTDTPVTRAEQGLITGTCDLTPAQAWMFANGSSSPHHFNQSILLQLPNQIDAVVLDKALRAVVRHHDAIRLRFQHNEGRWSSYFSPFDAQQSVLEMIDLSTVWGAQQSSMLEAACADTQRGLNLDSGPLMRVVLFQLGPLQPPRMLIVAHHLVMDGVSWRILLEQLWQGYTQIAAGDSPALPAKTTSLATYCARLLEFANSDDMRKEIAYWQSVPPASSTVLPVDTDGNNTEGEMQEVRVELDEQASQIILTEVPAVFNTQINDVLLTAFARALIRWSELETAYFDLEGHGRESLFDDIDLSRTIGWFTSIFPVTLHIDSDSSVVDSLCSVRDQLLAIPRRGVGFGILRYLAKNEAVREALNHLPARDISFNYMGQFGGDEDGTIRAASEDQGAMRDPNNERAHLLEVEGVVSFGRLGFTWGYSGDQFAADSIQEVAGMMLDELHAIVDAVNEKRSDELNVEDFPAARMEQDDLDRLIAKLKV